MNSPTLFALDFQTVFIETPSEIALSIARNYLLTNYPAIREERLKLLSRGKDETTEVFIFILWRENGETWFRVTLSNLTPISCSII